MMGKFWSYFKKEWDRLGPLPLSDPIDWFMNKEGFDSAKKMKYISTYLRQIR